MNMAPRTWIATRRSPASQYPKNAAKTGSIVSMMAVLAAGIFCWTVVCIQNAAADATSPVSIIANHTSGGGASTGSKTGHITAKRTAIDKVWARVSALASCSEA